MVKDEDIFEAFRICLHHKSGSPSAVKYFYGFEEDLIHLSDEINKRIYHPTTSTAFVVTKPTYREVFAANFRDRVVHHYIAKRVEPLLEQVFSPRTFNCRKGKGVLYGVATLENDLKEASENYIRDCWIMKLDLQGFFMSINKRLINVLLQDFIEQNYFGEDKEDVLWLCEVITLHSPELDCTKRSPDNLWDYLPPNKSLFTNGEGLGLPIGNLPSQLHANFFLTGLDYLISELGFKWYGRYVDDFYIIGHDKEYMLAIVPVIRDFLKETIDVTLHPKKFYIQHYSKGVRFTGTQVLPGRKYVLKRVIGNLNRVIYFFNENTRINITIKKLEKYVQSINSYLGLLRHYDSYHFRRQALLSIRKELWYFVFVKGSFEVLSIKKEAYRILTPVKDEEHHSFYNLS